jgi:hypothetical protein
VDRSGGKMLADDIQKGFPNGVQLPQELRRLCEFAEANEGTISGCFEFETEGHSAAQAWFGDDTRAASQFAVFGRGPDGSLYALWLHAGNDTGKAPVVLLDSECTDNKIIADNVRAFLRLLAIGYEEPGRFPTLEPEDPEGADALRTWLFDELGLESPANGTELVAAAQRQHPDLGVWIRTWQEQR